jgi:hypothetical protein
MYTESKLRKGVLKNRYISEEFDGNSMFGSLLTFVILVKSSYERGILSLPFGFFIYSQYILYRAALCGWGLGCISIFLVSLFSVYSTFLIIDTKTLLCQNRKTQYHDLCFYVLGYGGLIWAQISVWGNLVHKITKYIHYFDVMMKYLIPVVPQVVWVFISSIIILLIGLFRYLIFSVFCYCFVLGRMF